MHTKGADAVGTVSSVTAAFQIAVQILLGTVTSMFLTDTLFVDLNVHL